MNLYHLLVQVLDSPNHPRAYRELKKYYHDNNLEAEASAVAFLIESRFGKKYGTADDTTTVAGEGSGG
jgi:hypothetical protein